MNTSESFLSVKRDSQKKKIRACGRRRIDNGHSVSVNFGDVALKSNSTDVASRSSDDVGLKSNNSSVVDTRKKNEGGPR